MGQKDFTGIRIADESGMNFIVQGRIPEERFRYPKRSAAVDLHPSFIQLHTEIQLHRKIRKADEKIRSCLRILFQNGSVSKLSAVDLERIILQDWTDESVRASRFRALRKRQILAALRQVFRSLSYDRFSRDDFNLKAAGGLRKRGGHVAQGNIAVKRILDVYGLHDHALSSVHGKRKILKRFLFFPGAAGRKKPRQNKGRQTPKTHRDGIAKFEELPNGVYKLRESVPEGFLAADGILDLCLNVADGLVVYPKVIRKHLMAELPFMATENIMMDAVKAGGDRQELHERIRELSMEAGRVVKEEGKPNDLLDRIAADPMFTSLGVTKESLASVLDPADYVGRAPEQVTEYLRDVVKPVLDANSDVLGESAEINV